MRGPSPLHLLPVRTIHLIQRRTVLLLPRITTRVRVGKAPTIWTQPSRILDLR